MTEATQRRAELAPRPQGERVVFALRQAALMGVALLVAGLVTERLRPDETADRGMASTAFLWAIVVWLAVLLVNAIAHEESQMRVLERTPLYVAAGVGVFMFFTGLISLDAAPAGRRLVYVFANSVGAIMFWWGLISLGYLVTRRITS